MKIALLLFGIFVILLTIMVIIEIIDDKKRVNK